MEIDCIIRGRDRDHFGEWWTMGDDIVLEVPLDQKVYKVIEMVQDILAARFTPENAEEPDYGEHGNAMHTSRLDVVIPIELAGGKVDDRNVTESEWSMSLQRVGLTANKCLLEFRPKEPGLWAWHPLQYHKDLFRELLVKTIGKRQVQLTELVEEVKHKRPPPIRTSTKVFLRCYPEVFWVTTSLNSGLSDVRLNKTLEPPCFL
jgi:hypothetical protein